MCDQAHFSNNKPECKDKETQSVAELRVSDQAHCSIMKAENKDQDTQRVAELRVSKRAHCSIIKAKNKWIRRQTIIGLIVNDVLGLVNGDIQMLLFNGLSKLTLQRSGQLL